MRKLCDAGITPHLLLRSTSRLGRIDDLTQQCHVHIGDLVDQDSLRRIIDLVRPDVLFYAAGHGSHKGESGRDEIFRNNLIATYNLLAATKQVPNCHIIYSGSSLEHGKQNEPLRDELSALDPVSFYAAVKAAASVLVQQAARHERQLITILKPFAMYGPGEPSGRLIPTTIRAGLEGRILELTQPGFVRDFVFIDDVADAYLKAAVNNRVAGEVINIADGRSVANEEVVALIEKQLGISIEKQIGVYPPRSTDTTFWCADIAKAKNLLGWKPTHTLEHGIAKTITWFRKHGFEY